MAELNACCQEGCHEVGGMIVAAVQVSENSQGAAEASLSAPLGLASKAVGSIPWLEWPLMGELCWRYHHGRWHTQPILAASQL